MSDLTHIAMRHPDLGLTADVAAGSEWVWQARGWQLAEAPDPAAANTDVPPPADETTNRPAARKRANDSQEN